MKDEKTNNAAEATPQRTYGGVTPEQVKAWEEQYEGGFYTVEAQVEGDRWIGAYFKYPDREVYARCAKLLSQDDLMSLGQLLVASSSYLGGDEIIRQQEEPKNIKERKAVNQLLMSCWGVITEGLPQTRLIKK